MARKKSSQEWFALVELWRDGKIRGGKMRKADFCEKHGVNINTFSNWVRKHRKQTSFVEVKPEPTMVCEPDQIVRFSFSGGVSAEVPAELALLFMHQISSK